MRAAAGRWAYSKPRGRPAALVGVAPLMQLVQATGDFGLVVSGHSAGWPAAAARAGALGLEPARRRRVGAPPRTIHWGALRTPSVLGMLGLLFFTAMGVDLILRGAGRVVEGQLRRN